MNKRGFALDLWRLNPRELVLDLQGVDNLKVGLQARFHLPNPRVLLPELFLESPGLVLKEGLHRHLSVHSVGQRREAFTLQLAEIIDQCVTNNIISVCHFGYLLYYIPISISAYWSRKGERRHDSGEDLRETWAVPVVHNLIAGND